MDLSWRGRTAWPLSGWTQDPDSLGSSWLGSSNCVNPGKLLKPYVLLFLHVWDDKRAALQLPARIKRFVCVTHSFMPIRTNGCVSIA